MKNRVFFLLMVLMLSLSAAAQPPETNYLGTVIASGFRSSIPLASDGPFPIGFTFTFFGNNFTQFYVSANGMVLFTDPDGFYNTEAVIPTLTTTPNNFIAPFWDNLSIVDGGNIMYHSVGASSNKKCIIQFKNMGFDPNPTPLGTFTVILYETTNVIQIQYRLIVDPYSANPHGGSAAIGLENSDGSGGVLYAFHQPDAVFSEDAISFTPSGPTTYTVNSDATYDGVFLTTNLTIPDPGIVDLISPSEDAVIGADLTFEWASATNASSYYLVIDTNPDLSTATYVDAGLNLSYDTTGLILDKTYYWTVFSYNATSFTWSEVSRFNTSSIPPLTGIPREFYVAQGDEREIKLQYTGGDASAKTATVTFLPSQGQLYQVSGGVKDVQITSVPATVTDSQYRLIYVASGGTGNGVGNFKFKFHDNTGDSPEAIIKINVNPPGIPNFLNASRSANVEVQFDRKMNDPTGKHNQFTVTVEGTPATINSASLKTGDPYSIVLTLATPLTGPETVFVSYTQGDVSATTGGLLPSFIDQPVTLLSQTITFTTNLNKKYNDPPFSLSATATSGLTSFTFSSSNMSVATIAGSVVTIHTVGTSDITAFQAGDAIYAPARYIRTLTVAKGDQTITFSALPAKTYGDADFVLSATASSGLSVSFASNNPSVATVAGTTVHIVGAGTATITASQAGNSLWNPAPDVPQTLTVNKANQTITFGGLPTKTYGDADFVLSATVSSGLSVSYTSSVPAVATVTGNLVHIVSAGTTTITASQAGNLNYNPAADVPQTLTVNKADQTITFNSLPNKVYGDADFNPSATASSGLSVSYSSSNSAVATITGNLIHIVEPGTSVITASQAGDANYNSATDVPQSLTVNKADLTFTADNKTKDYMADIPELTYTVSGFVNSENESVLDVLPSIQTTALQDSPAGDYPITLSGGNDNNYNYLYVEGTLSVILTSHKDIMYLFTPNGDAYNQYWELPELAVWGKCEVRVFNRWGKLVFEDDNYNNLWDGTSSGTPLPEGPYYFVIKTQNAGTVKGTVNIVR